ncbi:putative phosphatidylinositol(PI)/phosphatidylcholine(PC) transfer protein [Mycosarcoma maydis]|uniref:Phosphatidylinositol(PI)/phosphatidylcholine(PC) transfer protein n=1 Tax=Mycosarcoma maydis TaxID=5270 RepID=A0A0D1EAS7_MYCMD|nr:putative phosphatidylinositol(PI)/phosphatidylcholine(PC) transfer protein [Ustilago maydis 521]KIS71490.1 putative phosphatidylinositol(PI)/phosphatidylcholine(PC) transfer protein [Ustilago maydis 521]|eukprot:XP_011387425.1 putative phosphatidylinositol(PI)/phosphatidylcholine(PC) transfer protein [Ustilago maydis 521]
MFRKHDKDTSKGSKKDSKSKPSMTDAAKGGRPGNLDASQQEALDTFRNTIQHKGIFNPERHDDACLCRFLRARKWDLAAAEAMFTEAEKWRKDFKVEELYHSFEYPEKEDVDKYYPQYYHKTDNEGRPIYIEQLGKLDLKALYQVTTPERQIQKLVVEYEKFQRERLPVCSAHKGGLVETSCTIMDLKNVGVSQFWKVSGYVQQASNIGQHYYPETMGKFYIINSPYIFTTVWSVIKGWLDPVTVEKIKILGHKYQDELLQQIPAENLPVDLGGKCQCSGGCSLSDAGPWNTDEGRKIIENVRAEEKQKREQHERDGPAAPPAVAENGSTAA